MIRLAIERRQSREEDVCDDSAGPNVTLLVVVLVENLRGDIVRSAKFLVKGSLWVVNKRGSKVNDLDLVELLVLLEEDILRLEITMHDVGLVAVVDAREDLLHENCCVTFCKFASVEDLVEEFTTLADSSFKRMAQIK